MKAILLKNGFGLGNVRIDEIVKPQIQANEVLVKVSAVSLNYLDLLIIKGDFKNSLPHILGSDAVGIVEKIGDKVTQFKIGDTVSTHFTQSWQAGKIKLSDMQTRLGTDVQGVFSEYIALSENSLLKTPSNLTAEESSTLPLAGLTAWEAIVNAGSLQPGQTVLLQGTGGVSIFALQFAKMLGAKVIITSGSDEKLIKAKSLGADVVLNYRTNNKWQQDIIALTNGNGVDVALEILGSELDQTLQYLALNGRIVLIGFLKGTKVNLDVLNILQKNATIIGIKVGAKSSFEAMNKAIEVNNIKPVVDKIFQLSEFEDAFKYLESAKHFGKIVVAF